MENYFQKYQNVTYQYCLLLSVDYIVVGIKSEIPKDLIFQYLSFPINTLGPPCPLIPLPLNTPAHFTIFRGKWTDELDSFYIVTLHWTAIVKFQQCTVGSVV